MDEDIFAIVEKIKDTTGQPILKERANAPDNYTLFGYPVELSEVMNDISADAVDTPFIVFGSFTYFYLGVRKAKTAEIGLNGTNFSESKKTLKVTERIAGVNVIPEAFAVLKTAAA